MEYLDMLHEANDFLKKQIKTVPDVAVILGTGLGSLSDYIENKTVIKYTDIPHFPKSTVPGHAGEFIIGNIYNKNIIAMNGRFHYYEGYSMEQVTFPVRVIKSLGVQKIIVTNASGGMNPDFKAGDLMFITDHINMMNDNPLIGKNYEEFGPRFPDMSNAYDKQFLNIGLNTAKKLNIPVQKGIYVALTGPMYETPAELKMLRLIGADAVGMSTIPEVIIANHANMKVLGISCITDMAIPDSLEPLDHERVIATAEKAKNNFVSLVRGIIKNM